MVWKWDCALMVEVILGYTNSMKTAISVPDITYAQVEAKVSELGMSRSQFYALAADRYLRELSQNELIDQVNQALDLETAVSLREREEFVIAGMTSSQIRLGNEQW